MFENGYKYVLDHAAFADEGRLTGTWEDYYFGANPKVYVSADRYIVDEADLWAYTWKDGVTLDLTGHAAVEPTDTTDGNVFYYTDPQGKYYLPDEPGFYREVSASDVVIRRLREETSYVDLNGKTQDTLALEVKAEMTALNNDWYVVNHNVTFSDRLTITGDVNLILEDGCTLTAHKGITVNSGEATLTVWAQSGGTGALKVDSVERYTAGIGGEDKDTDSGAVTINGGTVTYSPLNYIHNALNGGTDDEDLKNAVKALYWYWKAADAYFPV